MTVDQDRWLSSHPRRPGLRLKKRRKQTVLDQAGDSARDGFSFNLPFVDVLDQLVLLRIIAGRKDARVRPQCEPDSNRKVVKGSTSFVLKSLISLCNLWVFCVSVVVFTNNVLTTETHRWHREEVATYALLCATSAFSVPLWLKIA